MHRKLFGEYLLSGESINGIMFLLVDVGDVFTLEEHRSFVFLGMQRLVDDVFRQIRRR